MPSSAFRSPPQAVAGAAQPGRHSLAKLVHGQGRVDLAPCRQGVFLVPTAQVRAGANLLQDFRDAPVIRVNLHCRPWVGIRTVGLAGVLRLDPDEARVAGCDALPITSPRMISAAGRNDEKRAVASEAKLRQRAR